MNIKKQKQRAIKYGIGFIVFMAVFTATTAIKAGTADNVIGWIWGGSDDGGGNKTGLGWISMNNIDPGAGGAPYGVNIPTIADGKLSGMAWSENLGWISFDEANLTGCPISDATYGCAAFRRGSDIGGWARIISIVQAGANSGGWSGWIHLKDTVGSKYGTAFDGVTGKFSGTAWSDELGYISFRGNVGAPEEYGAKLAPQMKLTTSVGTGGTVVSNIGGINCVSATCFADYNRDSMVTLTESVLPGNTFTKWTTTDPASLCNNSTAATCTVKMDIAKTVTAVVTPDPYCGDGIVNVVTEQCDEGSKNGDPCPEKCDASCKFITTACPSPRDMTGWVEVAPQN